MLGTVSNIFHEALGVQCDQIWRVTRQMAVFEDSRRAKILDGGWRVSGGQKFGWFVLSKIAKKAGLLKKISRIARKKINFLVLFKNVKNLGWLIFFWVGMYLHGLSRRDFNFFK